MCVCVCVRVCVCWYMLLLHNSLQVAIAVCGCVHFCAPCMRAWARVRCGWVGGGGGVDEWMLQTFSHTHSLSLTHQETLRGEGPLVVVQVQLAEVQVHLVAVQVQQQAAVQVHLAVVQVHLLVVQRQKQRCLLMQLKQEKVKTCSSIVC